jgi:hypothetical protein
MMASLIETIARLAGPKTSKASKMDSFHDMFGTSCPLI